MSASRDFAALSREQAIDAGVYANSREFFPEVASAKLEKAALVKEVRATFGVPPGIDSARPATAASVAELLPRRRLGRNRLAFHHGERRALRTSCGRSLVQERWGTAQFLDPDLKPQGLMRFAKQLV